jgi:hypothetical protein
MSGNDGNTIPGNAIVIENAPSSGSSDQGNIQNFMFPPTFIKYSSNERYRDYHPNINMIIFQILITLYDFAHDHIKSIDKIVADVDNKILGICQKKRKIEKLEGGGQHGGQINSAIGIKLTEDEEECFLDVKDDLYFILSSVISYMDMPEILKSDVNDDINPDLNALIEELSAKNEQKVLSEETDKMITEGVPVNSNKIYLHIFCFVLNLIFTESTGSNSNENLTYFIIEHVDGDKIVISENIPNNNDSKMEVSQDAAAREAAAESSSSSSTQESSTYTNNICSNNICSIKRTILDTICLMWNNDIHKNIFNILKDTNFFYIFIYNLLENRGFAQQQQENTIGKNLMDAIGNHFFEDHALARGVESHNEDESSSSSQKDTGYDTPLNISDKRKRFKIELLTFHPIENKTIQQNLQYPKHIFKANKSNNNNNTANKNDNNIDPIISTEYSVRFTPNAKGGQSGGVNEQQLRNIIDFINRTTGNKPTPYLNNQVFRLYVCTVLTQLGILHNTQGKEDKENYRNGFVLTPFGDLLMTGKINIVNRHDDPIQQELHPTLYIVRTILTQLEPVWNRNISLGQGRFNKSHIFNHYKVIESTFVEHLNNLSKTIEGFFFTDLSLTDKDKKFIYNNASNVLGYNSSYSNSFLATTGPDGSVIFGEDNIIISDAAIIDAFGSKNIKVRPNLELANRNFLISGVSNYNDHYDPNVVFNGIINIDEVSVEGGAVLNKSENTLAQDFRIDCNVGIEYKNQFNFTDRNLTEYKHKAVNINTMSPELSNIRKNMLDKLIDLFDITNLNDPFSTIYTQDTKIIELLAITLNKTECDLLQILLTVLKNGGIQNYVYQGENVIGYNSDGNALRLISHNDLTASIITYFMLIFGYHTWNNDRFEYYIGNEGKNEFAYLNDTRLGRLIVGRTEGLDVYLHENGGGGFQLIQYIKQGDIRPVSVEGQAKAESTEQLKMEGEGEDTCRGRRNKDDICVISGGSKLCSTRRVKLRKKYITIKKNKILKKGTKKHYKKKYKTKRLF